MPDLYSEVRSIALPTVFGWLGVDLSQFKTRKAGKEWYGKCFFHSAKTNNTSLSFTDELWNCFSCQSKGRGAIDAVKLYRQCGFKEAVDWLQERLGTAPAIKSLPNQKEPLVSDSDEPQPLLKDTWRKFAVPCPWLEARCPDAAVRERYGIFCYNNPARKSVYSGRVMIPVRNMEGVLYGYLGRSTNTNHHEGEPKYLFPKGLAKGRFLFGAHELWAGRPHRIVYLVESPFCVLKFAAMGLPAVSPFGWSVSPEQAKSLVGLTKGVIYLPDRDKTQEACKCASELAQSVWLRFPPLPAGCLDPESLSYEEVLALTK